MVTVADDGQGFDPARVRATASGGLGLFGMNERAGYLGGRPIIARWGKYLFISEDDLDKGERFLTMELVAGS